MSVHPSVRLYVRRYVHNETQCSHKPFGDIARGRPAFHDGMTFKDIRGQGQGHRAPKYSKMADLKVYLLRHC